MASPTTITAAQPSTTMSSSSLFDLLLGLPMELFDLVIEKLPVVDQVAFSITCRAARRMLLRSHLRDLDWVSFRHQSTWPVSYDYSVPKLDPTDCIEFLRKRLAKDLAKQFVYCHDCYQLHRFWDSATETSRDAIAQVLDINPSNYRRLCNMHRNQPLWLFEGMGQFSITKRQCILIRHYHRHGYGIDPKYFCRNIEIPVQVTPWLYQAMLSPQPAPRWRRKIKMVPGEDDPEEPFLVVQHELVVHGNGTASAKRSARRYLDDTTYWLCPHLRTHAVGNASSDRGECSRPPRIRTGLKDLGSAAPGIPHNESHARRTRLCR